MSDDRDRRAAAEALAGSGGGGGGEMARLIGEFDWSKTSLGPPETWPPVLRTTLRIVLANAFPQVLWWGPQYIQFYNDAWLPVPGAKHPERALGQPAHECWEEIWSVIGPLIDRLIRTIRQLSREEAGRSPRWR